MTVRLQVGLLGPGATAAREDVGRAGERGAVVRLIAIHAGGGAGFVPGSDHEGIARDGHGLAKAIIRIRVARLQVGLLAPEGAAAHEDIGRAGPRGAARVGKRIHARVVGAFTSDYVSEIEHFPSDYSRQATG